MDKKYLIYAIVFLIITIILGTASKLLLKRLEYKDIKSQSECENPKNWKSGECSIWYGNLCRKAKLDGLTCVSEGNVGPLIFGIGSIFSFIIFLTYIILSLKK